MKKLLFFTAVLMLFACAKVDQDYYADHEGYQQSLNPEHTFRILTDSEFSWTLSTESGTFVTGHEQSVTFRGQEGDTAELYVYLVDPALVKIEFYTNGDLWGSRASSCELYTYQLSVGL